jgi:hypothetical protein
MLQAFGRARPWDSPVAELLDRAALMFSVPAALFGAAKLVRRSHELRNPICSAGPVSRIRPTTASRRKLARRWPALRSGPAGCRWSWSRGHTFIDPSNEALGASSRLDDGVHDVAIVGADSVAGVTEEVPAAVLFCAMPYSTDGLPLKT